MRILLINAPVSRPSPHSMLSPPLGLEYIASTLATEGHDVDGVDLNLSWGRPYDLERLIARVAPRMVGISAHTETFPAALVVARRIKAVDSRVKVVLGGPHPTILPQDALADSAVDFVVRGEGEMAMAELARAIAGEGDLGQIKGLAYRDGDGLKLNHPGELISPDKLTPPARHLFPEEFYETSWSVLAARGGCPFRCPFCSASAIWGGRRMQRSVESVVRETEDLVIKYEADYIFFVDDIFTLNKRWVYQLCRLLEKDGCSLRWGCATRVDMVDEDLLRCMAEAGCRAVQFGVESGSQRVLDLVKGIKKEQVLAAIEAATNFGIDVAASFMVPFPEDTPETLQETKEFMREVQRSGGRILLSFTTPFPGTYLFEHVEELGLRILASGWEEYDAKHNILETGYLSSRQIGAFITGLADELGLQQAIQ